MVPYDIIVYKMQLIKNDAKLSNPELDECNSRFVWIKFMNYWLPLPLVHQKSQLSILDPAKNLKKCFQNSIYSCKYEYYTT